MITVTKEEFYEYVNPRDILVSASDPKVTTWKTRNGLLVGESTGYARDSEDEKWYRLTEAAHKELKGQK